MGPYGGPPGGFASATPTTSAGALWGRVWLAVVTGVVMLCLVSGTIFAVVVVPWLSRQAEQTRHEPDYAPVPLGPDLPADPPLPSGRDGVAPQAGDRYHVPVTGQPSRGAPDALVTIVEIGEFECPFCARAKPTIDRILSEYDGRVRFVWLDNPLPFHRRAMPAAEAAAEARAQGGDPKFWAMYDLLFDNPQALSDADLSRYAEQLRMDMGRYRSALSSGAHRADIEADQGLAQRLGQRGTPTFFVNGRLLRGAQPYERFRDLIEQELPHAQRLVDSGVPRAALYDRVIEDGMRTAAPAPPSEPVAPEVAAVQNVPLEGPLPSKGRRDALVTIVEFTDFQCPFCARVQPTLAQLVESNPELRVVFMNNPLSFHRDAGPAAQAALEAYAQGGDARFWQMHDLLFASQRQLSERDLERFAERVGLDMARYRLAMRTGAHRDVIARQQALSARLGATGTPSFFINGRKLVGAQPAAAFQRVIDEALADARRREAQGTPRDRIYDEIMRSAAR